MIISYFKRQELSRVFEWSAFDKECVKRGHTRQVQSVYMNLSEIFLIAHHTSVKNYICVHLRFISGVATQCCWHKKQFFHYQKFLEVQKGLAAPGV